TRWWWCDEEDAVSLRTTMFSPSDLSFSDLFFLLRWVLFCVFLLAVVVVRFVVVARQKFFSDEFWLDSSLLRVVLGFGVVGFWVRVPLRQLHLSNHVVFLPAWRLLPSLFCFIRIWCLFLFLVLVRWASDSVLVPSLEFVGSVSSCSSSCILAARRGSGGFVWPWCCGGEIRRCGGDGWRC
ncbi:hypothetical protein L195_g052711, partial [Trifolium pratense]